jgi:hypothetical protein
MAGGGRRSRPKAATHRQFDAALQPHETGHSLQAHYPRLASGRTADFPADGLLNAFCPGDGRDGVAGTPPSGCGSLECDDMAQRCAGRGTNRGDARICGSDILFRVGLPNAS